MMKFAALLFSVLFLSGGCYIRSKKYWRTEEAKMESCRKEWVYEDLPQMTEIKVLLFRDKFNFDVRIYPAFVIGVTNGLDTIAVIDKDFEGEIKIGQEIVVLTANWTAIEKVEIDPVFSVYPRSRTNDLHCAVKKVYWGKFRLD